MTVSTLIQEEKLITGEEFLDMPGTNLTELIDGVIVYVEAADAEHGYFVVKIATELGNFVKSKKLGWLVGGGTGVYIRRNPDRIRAVDVAFISRERCPKRPGRGYLEVAPELIVEVVSPNDRWSDINDKLEDYFSISVDEVWMVDPGNESVRRYQSLTDVELFIAPAKMPGNGLLDGFVLDLGELFSAE